MTKIFESSINSLKISYTRSRFTKINYSVLAVVFPGIAVFVFFGKVKPETGAEHSEFAPIILVSMGILMSAFGLLFFSWVFDATEYYFDRTADRFYLTGRRNFFRKWIIEGAVSHITEVSYKIYGNDECHYSEIYLKHRLSGLLTETIKCGTGEKSEDENIVEYIRKFLESEKIIS